MSIVSPYLPGEKKCDPANSADPAPGRRLKV